MIATIIYEVYVAKSPFLRKDLFRDMSSIVTYIAACLQGLMVCITAPLNPAEPMTDISDTLTVVVRDIILVSVQNTMLCK